MYLCGYKLSQAFMRIFITIKLQTNEKNIYTEKKPKDIVKLKTAYEQAYIAYTRAVTSADSTTEERKKLFAEYRESYDAYIAATAETSNK